MRRVADLGELLRLAKIVGGVYGAVLVIIGALAAYYVRVWMPRAVGRVFEREKQQMEQRLAKELAHHEARLRVDEESRRHLLHLGADAVVEAVSAATEFQDAVSFAAGAVKLNDRFNMPAEVERYAEKMMAARMKLTGAGVLLPPQLDARCDAMKGAAAALTKRIIKAWRVVDAAERARAVDAAFTEENFAARVAEFQDGARAWKALHWEKFAPDTATSTSSPMASGAPGAP